VSSEPLGKFSTLPDSSTSYQLLDSHRHDPICGVLNMELLQFYYSDQSDRIPSGAVYSLCINWGRTHDDGNAHDPPVLKVTQCVLIF
jgi:hypothetical protein